MQLGEGLAGLLPPVEAKAARKELAYLGVRVIRVVDKSLDASAVRCRLSADDPLRVHLVLRRVAVIPTGLR